MRQRPKRASSAKKGRHRKEPDPQAKALGARVKLLREERGFNFDAFVEETGLGRGYVSELERGLVVPTIHALAKVATALELTIADIVAGDSPRERLFAATRGLSPTQIDRLLGLVGPRKGEARVAPPDARPLRAADVRTPVQARRRT